MSAGPDAPPDEAGAGTRTIRDTTRNLIHSILLDVWPRHGTIVDFGINTQEHYEALYYPLRHGDITPEQVDAALGKGAVLTELVNAAPHNPHKGIVFITSWDELSLAEPPNISGGSGPDGGASGAGSAPRPTLSAIAGAPPQEVGPDESRRKAMENSNDGCSM